MFSLILTTPLPSTLKVNTFSDITKKAINNRISRAKLISSPKTIFYRKIKNIKQTLINKWFLNFIVDE